MPRIDTGVSVGSRVRALRAIRGWTQERLTAESGYNKVTIERAERGIPISRAAADAINGALLRGIKSPSEAIPIWPIFREQIVAEELQRQATSLPTRQQSRLDFFRRVMSNASLTRRVPRRLVETQMEAAASITPELGIGYKHLRRFCPDEVSVAFSVPFVLMHAAMSAVSRNNSIRLTSSYEHSHNGALVTKLIAGDLTPLPDVIAIGDAPFATLCQSNLIQNYQLLGPAYEVEMALLAPTTRVSVPLSKCQLHFDQQALTAQLFEFERLERLGRLGSSRPVHADTHDALHLLMDRNLDPHFVIPLWAPNSRAYELLNISRPLQNEPSPRGPAVMLVRRDFGGGDAQKARNFLYRAFVDEALKIVMNPAAATDACTTVLQDSRYVDVFDRVLGFGPR